MSEWNKWMTWWKKHPNFNAFSHVAGGAGGGFLLVSYFGIGGTTLGWTLVVIWATVHLWSWFDR